MTSLARSRCLNCFIYCIVCLFWRGCFFFFFVCILFPKWCSSGAENFCHIQDTVPRLGPRAVGWNAYCFHWASMWTECFKDLLLVCMRAYACGGEGRTKFECLWHKRWKRNLSLTVSCVWPFPVLLHCCTTCCFTVTFCFCFFFPTPPTLLLQPLSFVERAAKLSARGDEEGRDVGRETFFFFLL